MTSIAASSLPPVSSTPVESDSFAAEHRLAAIANHGAGQGRGPLLAAGHGIGPQILHCLPHLVDIARVVDRLAEPNRNAARMRRLGHFQKNFPPRKLKMLPHNLIEVHGNDRCIRYPVGFPTRPA